MAATIATEIPAPASTRGKTLVQGPLCSGADRHRARRPRRLAVAGLATNDWIKALGDGFIKLIKMVIAPIIFCTVVSGIAHIQDAKKVGRIGVKALVYFEIVSTFALVIGLDRRQCGPAGRRLRRRRGRCAARSPAYAKQAEAQKTRRFLPAHHSGHGGRRLRARRDPAGAAVLDPVRLCADGPRRARPHHPRLHRRRRACGVRRHRHRDEGRADRRVRRDGLHHRQVRHRRAPAI